MSEADELAALLRRELDATHVEVRDESARHAGHPGAREGRHFRALIVSPRFEGLSRVRAQKLVYQTLGKRMGSGGIHAFAMTTQTPTVWRRHQKLS